MALLNFLGENRTLIVNKASVIGTIGVEAEPTIRCLQFASIIPKYTHHAGVPGHFFVFGQPPQFTSGRPMRANFKEAGDAVIFALKQSPTTTYLYGITIEALIAWEPPARPGQTIVEDILQTWKATHSDIISLQVLEDTETHKLKDLADKLMSHLPFLAQHKVRSSKDAAAWCKRTFESNVKAVCDMSEVEERKRAKEKSDTARDPAAIESAAGGAAAKELWVLRKKNMLAFAQYYEDSFEERFILVKTDETTKQPTDETVAAVRADLG